MTTIAFILLFVGTLIFLFSFVFKIKKNDFEKDYRLALQDFEKKKDLQENVDNSIENVDNIISEQEYINDVFENILPSFVSS